MAAENQARAYNLSYTTAKMNTFEEDSASPESPVDAAGVRETIPINELALYDDIQADFDAFLNEEWKDLLVGAIDVLQRR
jgi:hypothetical protein